MADLATLIAQLSKEADAPETSDKKPALHDGIGNAEANRWIFGRNNAGTIADLQREEGLSFW